MIRRTAGAVALAAMLSFSTSGFTVASPSPVHSGPQTKFSVQCRNTDGGVAVNFVVYPAPGDLSAPPAAGFAGGCPGWTAHLDPENLFVIDEASIEISTPTQNCRLERQKLPAKLDCERVTATIR